MTREEAKAWLEHHFDPIPDGTKQSEAVSLAIKALEQEPCDDVCEWFEQYVDIATDIVEFRFSDGTVKRAKRGLYMRDIEKSIRKMMIDHIANEKKQEPKWIPVSERLPEVNQRVLVTSYGRVCYAMMTSVDGNSGYPIFRLQDSLKERVICETTVHSEFTTSRIEAWMPLPKPYKAESEE